MKVTEINQPLIECFERNRSVLAINEDQIYMDFPVYKDLDSSILIAQVMIISPLYGVILFKVSQETSPERYDLQLEQSIKSLDLLYSQIFTRLLRNDKLKTDRRSVSVPINTILYAPLLSLPREGKTDGEVPILYSEPQLVNYLQSIRCELDNTIYKETLASIEGSKGLILPTPRETTTPNTKAEAANRAEREIALFDLKQKDAYLTPISGVSRLRGLAGSGKTVILCMKAALIHLKNPGATILYTFYTKSLYQHVRRMITRFYRQYADNDPDWDKIQVLHAWGSSSIPGVYSQACLENQAIPISFARARQINTTNPFKAACDDFLVNVPNPIATYDYILIDEGQDFPSSFIQMCLKLVKDNHLLFAYDDLQTIFQYQAPSAAEIFGREDMTFAEDIVLSKCYRNPREVLVAAHALGFGIYAQSISQMIESSEYWNDIGYTIESGQLKAGQDVVISRPEQNSLKSISDLFTKDQIVKCVTFETFDAEVQHVCVCINDDIKNQHLHPDDILVITVDDRYSSSYLNYIEKTLAQQYSIRSNNIHADQFSVKNFQEKGMVTLSTVHKAKGNEAYAVYIVGIDALMPGPRNYRDRNLIFTAMTRAKGWVTLSGIGGVAQSWKKEFDMAMNNFPYLKFRYPSKSDIRLMRRDMAGQSITENKRRKLIDDLLNEMSPEEARMFIEQRSLKKG